MTFGNAVAKALLWWVCVVVPLTLALMFTAFTLPTDQYTFVLLAIVSVGPWIALAGIFAHFYRRYRRFTAGGPSARQRAKYQAVRG